MVGQAFIGRAASCHLGANVSRRDRVLENLVRVRVRVGAWVRVRVGVHVMVRVRVGVMVALGVRVRVMVAVRVR
jgi:hypothetical protein